MFDNSLHFSKLLGLKGTDDNESEDVNTPIPSPRAPDLLSHDKKITSARGDISAGSSSGVQRCVTMLALRAPDHRKEAMLDDSNPSKTLAPFLPNSEDI